GHFRSSSNSTGSGKNRKPLSFQLRSTIRTQIFIRISPKGELIFSKHLNSQNFLQQPLDSTIELFKQFKKCSNSVK
nr:hypothetical protein [Succinivibrionaceae bacterium]